MRTKVLLKILGFIVWVINISWASAVGVTGVIIAVAILKWCTIDITAESLPLVKVIYLIALLGLVCKFASKYWSNKGTNNGMELIKWDGKMPIFKKEVKDE